MQNQKVKIKIEFYDKELSEYNCRTFTFELFYSPYGKLVIVTSDICPNYSFYIDVRYDFISDFECWCLYWLAVNFKPHKATIVK